MKPRLSVIIPTYKRTGSLLRLLKALELQSVRTSLEILVMDQNEPSLLNEWVSGLEIRRIFLERPNASLARNTGAARAQADILLFLDDDLVPEPEFCERGLRVFQQNPEMDCYCPWVKNSPELTDPLVNIQHKQPRKVKDWIFEISDTISAAVFIRRQPFIEFGGFDVALFDFARTAEDQEFFLRWNLLGRKLFYVADLAIFHDEGQVGGCDLRTDDYWITREKCIRSWIYRRKIHRGGNLRLRLADWWGLTRSIILNRQGLLSGFRAMSRQITLFRKAYRDTERALAPISQRYRELEKINHLLIS